MEAWITDIMDHYGYIGIFLLIMLENIFPPIPSEVILTFGGFMTMTTNMSVLGVAVAATIGSVAGAVVLYGIGLLINVDRLERLVDRWGHILRLTKKDVRKAQSWFDKYGVWTVFFCRFVPVIRSLISVPAGMARMNFWTFLLLTVVGTAIWNFVLIRIGAAVGSSWHEIVNYMDVFSNIVYVVLAVLIIVFVILFSKSEKDRRNEQKNAWRKNPSVLHESLRWSD
ncbi:DedA family protein [Virgibacillus sp. 179-BFC.A HS]|uniref:DedA family protein n=1 Tax=Tigheibacillus jepli TaxID=3035914 RepID=A0ABU5CD03_9BACI|nr:DedA family protein [Virgibacillus sp. 179-BFC.A HS]MDY0404211.1 DedA family protein [Virgibacillus sp. 179-BFC.A HS]